MEAALNLSHNTILQPFSRHAAPTLRQKHATFTPKFSQNKKHL